MELLRDTVLAGFNEMTENVRMLQAQDKRRKKAAFEDALTVAVRSIVVDPFS